MINKLSKILPFFAMSSSKDQARPIEPVSKVKGALDLQEDVHQAQVDAELACSFMRHQRDMLALVIDGVRPSKNSYKS